MTKTSKTIVQDLLREANYYWYDDNEDNIQPLNPEDFDPVVDKIFKANAVELEKLYAEINDSQREIILGLSKTLVPDKSLLPEPGYTVAQINPKALRVSTDPEDSYQISGQSDTGEKYDYYFTPLFEHHFPKCDLVAILTENTAIEVQDNTAEVLDVLPGGKASSHFWLGLQLGKVQEGDKIAFFLGNQIVDTFDKDHHVLHQAKWLLNGEERLELKVESGIGAFQQQQATTDALLDTLDVANTYEKQIFSRFSNSFLVVSLPSDIQEHRYRVPPHLDGTALTAKLSIKEPICWIKLECSLAIDNDYLLNNMLYPNSIPLVNRRLKDNYVVKRNYDRILLPMPTKDLFLDVHKVQDTRDKANGTAYQKVDFLSPNSTPGTFMLRGGSRVRRLNREDASQQIQRLVKVIEEEYRTFKEEGVNRLKEDFDVIEKAINRIKKQLPEYFREEEEKSSYFCVANFRPGISRLHYYYWETQGEAIKHLGDRVGLIVNSSDVSIANSRSIIPIQQGKGELRADDYINQLRVALLSRGRIMTKGDIKLYTKSRFGKLLEIDKISLELMTLEEGEWGRGILVQAHTTRTMSVTEAEIIRIELQNDLNARSTFFTHIKVALDHG